MTPQFRSEIETLEPVSDFIAMYNRVLDACGKVIVSAARPATVGETVTLMAQPIRFVREATEAEYQEQTRRITGKPSLAAASKFFYEVTTD
jgi:hypothetical protein